MMPYAQGDPTIWRRLPHGEDLFEPQRRHLAANAALGWREMFETQFPRRVGQPILYDAMHGVVLYYQGCCAWEETVLAAVTAPPPRAVRHADLGTLKTPRGIALGASPEPVRHAYGPAPLHRSTTTRSLRVLSYYRDQPVRGSGCGWFENFIFSADRLIEIQAGHGC